jgi:hypothetical protein
MLGISLALTAIRQGSSSPDQLPFEDNLIVFAGQSHMNGAGGTATNVDYPVLSTVARDGLVTFGPQIMQSLDDVVSPSRFGDYIAAVEQEYTRSSIDYTETPARGAGDMLFNLLEERAGLAFSSHGRRLVLTNFGNGNTTMANWLRDSGASFANETTNWGLIEKAAQQGKIKSEAAGKTFGVLAVAFSQGATDYDSATTKADYKSRLLQFSDDVQTYIKGHTGQSNPIYTVVVQNHSHATRGSTNNPYVAEAQAEAAEEDPLILLATPQYANLYGYSGVHHNNKESRRIGGYIGACIYERVLQNAWWNFLPAAITRHASDVIRVRYDVPANHKLTWIYDNPDSRTAAGVAGFRAENNHGFYPVQTGTTTDIALLTGKLPWIDGDSVYIRTAASLPSTLDLQYARGDDNAGNLACIPTTDAGIWPIEIDGNNRELARFAANFRKVVPA